MPVYFDGKDGWISLRLNRSLYPAVVAYLGNLPKDVVIYNHFGHYAIKIKAVWEVNSCIMFSRVYARGTRKHFHERLYVHVSNILIHLAHLP